jgi:hypothetical protein
MKRMRDGCGQSCRHERGEERLRSAATGSKSSACQKQQGVREMVLLDKDVVLMGGCADTVSMGWKVRALVPRCLTAAC